MFLTVDKFLPERGVTSQTVINVTALQITLMVICAGRVPQLSFTMYP